MSEVPAMPQLQMLWPERPAGRVPAVSLPDGYVMRTYRPEDDEAFIRLMQSATFTDWGRQTLDGALAKALPEGIFFAVCQASGQIAATAMATHCPTPELPFAGELGWVAADPAHQGKRLGRAVCAAALDRFKRAGYRCVYLRTDDWRLPAIRTYLRLGFVPLLVAPEMRERWRVLCEKLDWPSEPDSWPVAPAVKGDATS